MKKFYRRLILGVIGALSCAFCGILTLHAIGELDWGVNGYATANAAAIMLGDEAIKSLDAIGTTSTTATTSTTSTTTTTTTTTTSAVTTTTSATTTTAITTTTTEPVLVEEVRYYTDYEVAMLASAVCNEIGGSDNYAQLTAVAWCVCNRVDSTKWVESTIGATLQRSGQFAYYGGAVYEGKCYDVAATVLAEWNKEKNNPDYISPERTLPRDYLSFWGDGTYNHFSNDVNEIIPGT